MHTARGSGHVDPVGDPSEAESAGSTRRPPERFAQRRVLFCAAALALLLLLLPTPPGLALLRAIGALPPPASYTELAFAPSMLPPQTAARGAQVDFAFSIGDEQGAAADYAWRVLESTDSGPFVQAGSGSLRLDEGASGTVSTRVLMPSSGKRVLITVQLLATGQVIHYAVELKGSQ